jgi:hypothetical protein
MRALPTPNRRAGVTLIEVLIAIFVMALGLLALLTLFPLGALSMAQAIKYDRAAQAAANAAATMKAMDLLSDNQYINNPFNGVDATGTRLLAQPALGGPSYAVLFDPIGFNSYGGLSRTRVGYDAAAPTPGVIRTSSAWLQTAGQTNVASNVRPLIGAWFTSLDDMTFTNDGPGLGVPANDLGQPAGAGNFFQREGRYSWAALFRRAHLQESVTEIYIVIYNGRTTTLGATLAAAAETPLAVSATPGNNVLTVAPFPAATTPWPPDIRPGTWILDATPAPGHGDFYRVTNVAMGPASADLELQTPLKTAGISQVVIMDGVAEVIFKGVITP